MSMFKYVKEEYWDKLRVERDRNSYKVYFDLSSYMKSMPFPFIEKVEILFPDRIEERDYLEDEKSYNQLACRIIQDSIEVVLTKSDFESGRITADELSVVMTVSGGLGYIEAWNSEWGGVRFVKEQ